MKNTLGKLFGSAENINQPGNEQKGSYTVVLQERLSSSTLTWLSFNSEEDFQKWFDTPSGDNETGQRPSDHYLAVLKGVTPEVAQEVVAASNLSMHMHRQM